MFLFCSSFRIDLLILFIDLLDIFPSITKLPYWSREGSEPVLHQHCELSPARPGCTWNPHSSVLLPHSLLTHGTVMCFLQLPLIYPLIQGINQGQHTMLHMAIKIHCDANSAVAFALHWQVLTWWAIHKQPHMHTLMHTTKVNTL